MDLSRVDREKAAPNPAMAQWFAGNVLFQPLVCAVYPLNVLHPALQIVAGLLPPTHVFEAARAASAGTPNPTELLIGFVGSLVALAGALVFYLSSLAFAREHGRLGGAGE